MLFFTLNGGDLIWRSVARDICYSLLLVFEVFKIHEYALDNFK